MNNTDLKYPKEMYLDCGFYADDEEVEHATSKVVRCRKSHKCANCGNEIKIKDFSLRESGFIYNEPCSCYTCMVCLNKWLDEKKGVI